MRIPFSAYMACAITACALAVAPVARAYLTPGQSIVPGGNCQLSIPTIDTKFRPKATGARNESTTVANFVFCPLIAPIATSPDVFTYATIRLDSLDGNERIVSCTAVNRNRGSGSTPPVYSTKSAIAQGAPYISWSAADFFGAEGEPIFDSSVMSITCNLPPQTAILEVQGSYLYEVGG